MIAAQHLDLDAMYAGLPEIRQSPTDEGVLKAITIRPSTNERVSLEEATLSPEGGVHGDNWVTNSGLRLEDGRPNPDIQITLINARLIDLLAGDKSRWSLAGDQLYVDIDLGVENLPVGQQLAIGSVILQVTEEPHTGCAKFAERYGNAALRFVNSPEGKALRLRGMYAKVVQEGRIAVGDAIRKL
jgi:hypothetical protein